MGLFITGDNPKPGTLRNLRSLTFQVCTDRYAPRIAGILPIYSRTQTLHFVKNMYCRKQLHTPINETSVNPKLKAYGGKKLIVAQPADS